MRTRLIAAAVGIAVAMVLVASELVFAAVPLPLLNTDPNVLNQDPNSPYSFLDTVVPVPWVYGPANNDTTGGFVWNPAKQVVNSLLTSGTPPSVPPGAWNPNTLSGTMFVGRTNLANNNSTYCGYVSNSITTGGTPATMYPQWTWTEMQHALTTWADTWNLWAWSASPVNCPTRHKGTMDGTRVANASRREIQRALDGGAMVIVIPTLKSAQEALNIVKWAYYPPIGERSEGPNQAEAVIEAELGGPIPGGYRATFNNNLVIIAMLETVASNRNVGVIAPIPGIHGLFFASSDMGSTTGFSDGDADYIMLYQHQMSVVLATPGKMLCGAYAWRTGHGVGWTCFQD